MHFHYLSQRGKKPCIRSWEGLFAFENLTVKYFRCWLAKVGLQTKRNSDFTLLLKGTGQVSSAQSPNTLETPSFML